MKTQQKHIIHSGHRQRLYALANKAGIDSLSEIQALELLLTFVIPRKDTNELAHELLNTFGSFHKVLDADTEQLKRVKGIGDRASFLIGLFPQLFFYYKTSKLNKKIKLYNHKDLENYYLALLESKPNEELYITALNSNNEVLLTKKISKGNNNKVEVLNKDVLSFVNNTHAESIILAHCHPDSDSTPSIEDIKSTKSLMQVLKIINVKLIDHIIIGKDNTYSFFQNGLLEKI